MLAFAARSVRRTCRRFKVIGLSRSALRLTRVCVGCVILLAGQTSPAINLAGFAVPSAITTDGGVLQAASCGVRSTLWIEHYVAVLYLRPGARLDALRDPIEPKAVLMHVVEGRYLPDEIPARWRHALERELSERTLRSVRRAFSALSTGDLVTIMYLPDEGVSMGVNRKLVARSPDHRAVDAIIEAWASDAPLTTKLERLAQEHPC